MGAYIGFMWTALERWMNGVWMEWGGDVLIWGGLAIGRTYGGAPCQWNVVHSGCTPIHRVHTACNVQVCCFLKIWVHGKQHCVSRQKRQMKPWISKANIRIKIKKQASFGGIIFNDAAIRGTCCGCRMQQVVVSFWSEIFAVFQTSLVYGTNKACLSLKEVDFAM